MFFSFAENRHKMTPHKSYLLQALAVLFAVFAPLSHAQVIINELMYAPYEPFGTTNNTEYVELFNAGATPAELHDYRLDNGVDYSFDPGTILPPGNYIVVCEDLAAFTAAYPGVTNVVGNYGGALNNGGERVTLSRYVEREWTTVDTIKYIDGGPSDGGGTSLELVHPGFGRLRDHFYGAWMAATTASGTPGVVNSIHDPNPPPVAGAVIHEPPLPFPGSIVTIRARVAGFESDVLPDVHLEYRKDRYPQLAWQQTEMFDDGTHGDEIPGDGTYAVQVPAKGDPAMQDGELLEFRVAIQDTNGLSRTVPAISRSGVVNGPYSYLCYFGEDTGFNGEYPSYHLLMTELNRRGPAGLETRSDRSNVLLDGTFVTSGGRVIYNCGMRYRGYGSRVNPYSFRIEFPRGETWKGYQDINFLHNEPLLQYIGMRTMQQSAGGNVAPEAALCRIRLNDTVKSDLVNDSDNGPVYVRLEKIGRDFIAKHYPDNTGNIYRGERTGDLDFRANILDYQDGSYRSETNNPFTIWHSLSNLCWIVNQDTSLLPTLLTNRVNVPQWARHYAMQVGLENSEGGLVAARYCRGDDYYMYADPVDGQFDLLPWDFDTIVDEDEPGVNNSRSIWAFESNGGGAQPVVSNVLLNPPVVSRYVGNLLDVLDTTLSEASMAEVFDEMGSALSPTYRAVLEGFLAKRRTSIRGEINTELTASVTGAIAEGPSVSIVGSSSVSLSGKGPQGWTTRILVNGVDAAWRTRTGNWSTTNAVVLSNLANTVTIEALDHENRLLQTHTHQVIVQTNEAPRGGVVDVDTVWDASSGIVHLTSHVTIASSALLTINPGTVITLDPDVRLAVASGSLSVEGSADAPVRFYPADGTSSWNIQAQGAASTVTVQDAILAGGSIAVEDGAGLLLEDCELVDGDSDIVTARNAGETVIRRCRIAEYGATVFEQTPTTIEECLLEGMSEAGAEFIGCNATIRDTTVRHSRGAATVDGIRFGAGSVGLVTGCMLHDLSGDGVSAGARPTQPGAPSVVSPAGSVWRYLDDGSDQGTAWTGIGFDDSSWSSGPAQLGYDEGDESTLVGYGPDPDNRYPTTYFRRTFTVPESWNVVGLTMRLLRDDGAIIHLNGSEAVRQNMPAGTVDYQTWAAANVAGVDEDTFHASSVDPSLLVPGTNRLAVEVHQINGSSVDMSFDLEVVAEAIKDTGAGDTLSTVSVRDSLIHHCRTAIFSGESSVLSNNHNTITACATGIRGPGSLLPELVARDSYLPGIPVLVRVDLRDDQGQMAREVWDATATLEVSNPGITLSTNQVSLYNGRGSALVTFSGGGDFVLSATVDGKQASKALASLEGIPTNAVSGTLPGGATTWSGIVRVTGDLLVPAGHTLTIEPGTLVLLDGVSSGSGGTDIDVQGAVQSLGTRTSPVTFTAPDPARAWGELHHDSAAASLYRYTMITRAGHSPGGGHTGSGPALRLDGSTVVMDGSCVTDLDGKVMQSVSGSDITLRNCHLARAVMGPEVDNTAALLEETWITEMFGPNDNDGIYFHSQGVDQTIAMSGGVNAHFDDDAIDTLRAKVSINDYISRDAFDKGLSAYGGLVNAHRFISADNGTGVSIKERGTNTGRINLDHATIVGNSTGIQVRDKEGEPDVFLEYYVSNSIIEPGGIDPVQTDYSPTNIHIRHSLVGETWPGDGNTNVSAGFVNVAGRELQLREDSPCIDAGDPASPRDSDGTITDMGFYPFVSGETFVSTNRNAIVWDNETGVAGGAVFTWSDVNLDGTNVWPGEANINRNPWFRDPPEDDYRLLDISPAWQTASDGGDRGASYPSGAGPTAPSDLALLNFMVGDENRIRLQWQDNSPDETYFEVERSPDGTTWEVVATVAAGITNWTDLALAQNTEYSYRVRALHNRGESLYTDEPTVLTAMTTTLEALIAGLRITEIMYNPADSTNDVHEFLELGNVGATPLDLSGLTFSNGIDFNFTNGATLAPGEFFVIVKDTAAYAARYPTNAWHGVFANDTGLRNSGERLTIGDAENNTVFSVRYDDDSDTQWYPTTDGEGYSLVMNDPAGNPDSPSTWRAGSYVGGSPGYDDPAPPYGTIVIGEVLSHTDDPLEDAIEVCNTGTATVDIAGWYLSDDEDNVRKYRIAGASLPITAGGRHVFYAGTSFGADTNDPSYFAISEFGEQVYLSSADGTNLTSYRTWVKFGAADNGVSFGRYRRSDGGVDFVAMSNRTFGVDNPLTVEQFRDGTGLSNAYPRVGPIVINEIMYNPSATGKEFLELCNTAATNVPLFDQAWPSNTWDLDGAVEFAFPTNTWIAPGECVLVVGVEPAAFRSQFGLTNPAVQVFGPYNGDLANNGESVKLYRPGRPEPDGFVPRIRTDRVKYEDDAPWPTAADNGGPSLERVDARLYGNDPTNWIACTVGGTPGAANNVSGMPSVGFVRTRDSSPESNATVAVTISMFPPVAGTVTVSYVVGGTASAGVDYSLDAGTVVLWPHDTGAVLELDIRDDHLPEPDESVVVAITSVSGNARLGGNDTYTCTIVDTDYSNLQPPVIVPSGTNQFESSILVTIASAVDAAGIYYTLDGSLPTADDELYTEPFVLAQSARVHARTYLGEVNASAPVSALFLEQIPLGPPRVDNSPGARSLTPSSAELCGSVISTGQAPPTIHVYWGDTDGGEAVTNWSNSHDFGNQPVGPLTLSVTGLLPRVTYYYRFYGTNALGEFWAAPSASFTTPSGLPEIENICGSGGSGEPFSATNVPKGAVWKYLDNGSDQGSAWRVPGFDDSTWASGPAQLGYDEGDESTVTSYGPDSGDKYPTTYFRHHFSVGGAAGVTGLTVNLLRDDGAIVYLNDTEVVRDNMPAGAVTYDQYASGVVGGANEDTFFRFDYSGNPLVDGDNVVAVELHQCNPTSSDTSLDLELIGHGRESLGSSVSNVTRTTADISGTLVSTGAAPCEVTAYWGRQDGGSNTAAWANTNSLGPRAEGEIGMTLRGLLSGATYYYRYAAGNAYGFAIADCTAFFTMPAARVPLAMHEDDWHYRAGTNAPRADWKTADEAALDATWQSGPGGFGYSTASTNETVNCATLVTNMQNNYTTFYIRKQFAVTNTPSADWHLMFSMDWDDGYIAYLNGTNLLGTGRYAGAPAEPAFDTVADGDHECSTGANSPQPAVTNDLGPAAAWLGIGTHTVAIVGMNDSSNSSDFIMVPDLWLEETLNTNPPGTIVSGIIATDTVWTATNAPYNVVGGITVAGNATLTIEPGVAVRFYPGTGMTIQGALVADGTPSANILFTRNKPGTVWKRLTSRPSWSSPATSTSNTASSVTCRTTQAQGKATPSPSYPTTPTYPARPRPTSAGVSSYRLARASTRAIPTCSWSIATSPTTTATTTTSTSTASRFRRRSSATTGCSTPRTTT